MKRKNKEGTVTDKQLTKEEDRIFTTKHSNTTEGAQRVKLYLKLNEDRKKRRKLENPALSNT